MNKEKKPHTFSPHVKQDKISGGKKKVFFPLLKKRADCKYLKVTLKLLYSLFDSTENILFPGQPGNL